jgi:hypothetical protein
MADINVIWGYDDQWVTMWLFLFQLLQSLGAPHVESFNNIIREGLEKAVKDILAVEFYLQNDDRICMKFEVRLIWDTYVVVFSKILTHNPLTWKIWWAPNNACRWQMGFNPAFKGFNMYSRYPLLQSEETCPSDRKSCVCKKLLGTF